MVKKRHWSQLPERRLLELQVRDLKLKTQGTLVQKRVKRLYQELEQRQLVMRPKILIGDEWYSPDGVVAIAVPFYLFHPRLIQLEKKWMDEAEGEDLRWFMRIIRHEAGHCIDHAFQLSKTKKWRELFGSPDQTYQPEWYRPRLYSRNYVRNLEHGYAQSHPDEDFAETFAVWLNPDSHWKEVYKNWPGAIKKLRYVDSQMRRLRNRPPIHGMGERVYSFSRSQITLKKYFQRKIKQRAEENPDFFDTDLKRIFSGHQRLPLKKYGAEVLIEKRHDQLVRSIGRWSGERLYVVRNLLQRINERVSEKRLRMDKEKPTHQTELELGIYLSSLITHYRLTGRLKRDL